MAGIDTPAAFAALVGLVQNLTGMQGTVSEGVPESFATAVGAYVAIGDMDPTDKATGVVVQLVQEYVVAFGYRVKGQEAGAEVKLATFKDLFLRALLSDRTLGGNVADARIQPGLATTPIYLNFAGVETRVYPILVRTTQRDTIVPA